MSTLINRQGLFLQPNGPFAVVLFDEGALAVQMGVIYYGAMGSPVEDAWGITDRFWQDVDWGSDVYSIAWGPDGNTLFVSTGEVYGGANVFRLNLREKRAEVVYPSPPATTAGTSVMILGIDLTEHTLMLSFPDAEDKHDRQKVVAFPYDEPSNN